MPKTSVENEKKTQLAIIKEEDGSTALIDLYDWMKFIGSGNDWGYSEVKDRTGHKLISLKTGHKSKEKPYHEPIIGPFGIKMSLIKKEDINNYIIKLPPTKFENIYGQLHRAFPKHFNEKNPVELVELTTINKKNYICEWRRLTIQMVTKDGKKQTDSKLALNKYNNLPVNIAFKNMTILEAMEEVGGITTGRICKLEQAKVSYKTMCKKIV